MSNTFHYLKNISYFTAFIYKQYKNMTQPDDKESLPPFVKSWRQLYLWVVLSLVLTIALLYLFGKYFS